MTMKIVPREMGSMFRRSVTALMNGHSGGLLIKHRPGIGVNYTLSQASEEFFGTTPAIIDLDGETTPAELLAVLQRHSKTAMVMVLVNKESFADGPIVNMLKTACDRGVIVFQGTAQEIRFKFESLIVFVNNAPSEKMIPDVIEDRCLKLQVL